MRVFRWLTGLTFLLCVAGCSGGSAGSPTATGGTVSSALTGSSGQGGNSGTLQAVLDFGTTPRQLLGRLADTLTTFTVQVFTPTGQLLATQSGTTLRARARGR